MDSSGRMAWIGLEEIEFSMHQRERDQDSHFARLWSQVSEARAGAPDVVICGQPSLLASLSGLHFLRRKDMYELAFNE